MISWLSEEESGQGLVEYALILALIAIVVIVVPNCSASLTFASISSSLSFVEEVIVIAAVMLLSVMVMARTSPWYYEPTAQIWYISVHHYLFFAMLVHPYFLFV